MEQADPGEIRPVVVVGGGPGGSAAALSLRRHGLPAVVLDAARFPRDKICGDVVLPAAQATLSNLGVDTAALERLAHRCLGARYVAPGGREVEGEFREPGGEARPWWMIPRRALDAHLLDAARAHGADVREGWRVEGLLHGEGGAVEGVVARDPGGREQRIAASLVIGADGASSVVARSVGAAAPAPAQICLATRTYARGVVLPRPALEVFTASRVLPGCAWVAPVGPDVANVGLGVIKRDGQRLGRTPRQLFDEVRAEVPALADRLRGAALEPFRGWSLPGAGERRRLGGPGWVLVGDAGAMVDPFTGHGIHHALAAGAIAGQEAAQARDEGRPLADIAVPYARRCREAFLDEALVGERLQRLHAQPALVEWGIRLARVHPGLRATFMALVGHSAPRAGLLAPPRLLRTLLGRRGRPLEAYG